MFDIEETGSREPALWEARFDQGDFETLSRARWSAIGYSGQHVTGRFMECWSVNIKYWSNIFNIFRNHNFAPKVHPNYLRCVDFLSMNVKQFLGEYSWWR